MLYPELTPKDASASQKIFAWVNDAHDGLGHIADCQDEKTYLGINLLAAARHSFEYPEIAEHLVGLHDDCEKTGQAPDKSQLISVSRLIAKVQPVKFALQK